MVHAWRPATAFAAMLIAAGAHAAPIEAYGGLPSLENVAISPNGQMLAFAVTDGEKRKIVIQELETRQAVAVLNAGDQKVRDIRWGGDGHLIVTTSITGYIPFVDSPRLESFMATDFDLARKTQRQLLGELSRDAGRNLTTIIGVPEIRLVDGKPFAFVAGVHFENSEGRLAEFKVDLERDTARLEAQGLPSSQGFAIGDAGVLAEEDYDGADGAWILRTRRGDSWAPVRRETALDSPPDLVGGGRGAATVLVKFWVDHKPVLRELDAKGAEAGDPLPMPDADRGLYDSLTGKLIGLSSLVGDDQRYLFFAPHDQAVWRGITAAYPGERVKLIDYDSAYDKWVVLVDSPTQGPAYALVDLETKAARWIGNLYAGLAAADISPVRAIAFKAKDGLELGGYLTLPRGKGERGLPLVVLAHGGPAARDEPGFDWWAQALASRGYAVLQVNYRGSGGLGWDFQAAGFGQWGRKMQTDLSDGVRYLAAKGLIDPARVCIAGASYGGYAALAGATLDAGVYRCAASISGPSDLAKMVNWDKSTESSGTAAYVQRYWTRYMGPQATLDQISPAKHADKVKIPILLVHGKDDTVVAYQQSQIMADALAKVGRPCEFVTLKGEDHWLSRGATRQQMLSVLIVFLEKNNPPG
ncbi:MAG TPA: S9 family peptidase [Caulobacteraceae bacterium]|nr:S9 family peptidase [Caulobacteraceae bacterium]